MVKTKEFLNSDQIIEHLINKGIIIENENDFKEILNSNNYYYIMGYKFPFRLDSETYKEKTYFSDIYNLYRFDKKLKLIFMEPLLEIEQKMKTIFTNNFSTRYGFLETHLTDKQNYDINNEYLEELILKLKSQLNNYGKNNLALEFYNKKYNYIPIYVCIKILTFGMVRDLINCMKDNDKNHILNSITNTRELKTRDIINMLELLIIVRNMTAHDDMLFPYLHKKVNIKTMNIHQRFNLKKNKCGQYIEGKKDLLAVIIAIKCFISKETFDEFIDNILELIDESIGEFKNVTRQQLFNIMHLPVNLKKIKNL